MTDTVEPTDRTQVRRLRERGSYEREQINAILDEGMICHVAACVDGAPWMIPTAYGRRGDELLLHGAAGNHLLKVASEGGDIVVTVSLVDALVLARSTFHHSINYRSVVVFGPAAEVDDPVEKAAALEAIVDHLLPGRSVEARSPTDSELRQTRVIRLPISEASAKLRTGPPADDTEDLALPIWGGLLPLRTIAGPAVPDGLGLTGVAEPRGVVQPGRWGQAGLHE